jgi:hypothetical protein
MCQPILNCLECLPFNPGENIPSTFTERNMRYRRPDDRHALLSRQSVILLKGRWILSKQVKRLLAATWAMAIIALCACEQNPAVERFWPSGLSGEYSGTYEVITDVGQADELTKVWTIQAHFFGNEYSLMLRDSADNICQIGGTFDLFESGLAGHIKLAGTVQCTGWFVVGDFSVAGPSGDFDLLCLGWDVVMFRKADEAWEVTRLARVFY